jgi:hypothetical protein
MENSGEVKIKTKKTAKKTVETPVNEEEIPKPKKTTKKKAIPAQEVADNSVEDDCLFKMTGNEVGENYSEAIKEVLDALLLQYPKGLELKFQLTNQNEERELLDKITSFVQDIVDSSIR